MNVMNIGERVVLKTFWGMIAFFSVKNSIFAKQKLPRTVF